MTTDEPATAAAAASTLPEGLRYIQYQHALESKYLPAIRALISKDLSEPYSIYVYRYFLYQWAHLCYLVSRSSAREAGAVPILPRIRSLNAA